MKQGNVIVLLLAAFFVVVLFFLVDMILTGFLLSLGGLFWMQKQGIWSQYTLMAMSSSQ